MKRSFDILLSSVGLLLAAPLFIAIAIILKLESSGPIFYRCARVGVNGVLFEMLKFRTMIHNADVVNLRLCGAADVRVTAFGRLLRRTKLNELPQLINVLIGDMSFVGPRPEDPKFVKYYPEQWVQVLSIKPGIVGPNQIIHRNEEDLFPTGADPEEFYIHNILPAKLKVDAEYAANNSFYSDLVLLIKGTYATLFEGSLLSALILRRTTIYFMLIDGVISALAYLLANLLKYEFIPIAHYMWFSLLFVVLCNPVILLSTGLYRRNLRFFSIPDFVFSLEISSFCGLLLVGVNYFLFIAAGQSRAVFVLYPFVLAFLISGSRIAVRMILESREKNSQDPASPIRSLIYGAGRLGMQTLRNLQFESGVEVVGFIDDSPRMRCQSLGGVPVLGTVNDLVAIKALHNVDRVYISFLPDSPEDLEDRLEKFRLAGIEQVFGYYALAIVNDLGFGHEIVDEPTSTPYNC